ncbi:Stp1/IreP family PP2C-type Ser/Thr phosphatase [Marinobacter sp. M216]|uniref:Stp1/IreP family PP2C-type Ser/Thr phosphatase n=1 Tax=Marinobacter albus TaxID=3030833 RepID=A0ABT7HFN3_9GAMM|nr:MULTISPECIES: Stp1/IreP family PP2C-type Ser/Thr phosphatase [unclassified Marinobacter]MBW7472626.1 Stp1/IreP family PP2C-type Ser/Thr phosphatase [Marinobacter sp. F4218]MDK9559179.1 Stp1/IreP family PP2C-type Ser/Thr phosphatase [Marinobacter sp. M216]
MSVHVAGRSHTGVVRESNQDVVAWQVRDDGGAALMLVADGMGGYQGGEIASRLAADSVMEALTPGLFAGEEPTRKNLGAALALANERIQVRRASDSQLDKMGTTLVVAWIEGSTAHVAHVGDSRCYLIRHGQADCLTRDDTVVQNMLEDGSISETDAPNVPFRNVLTRAVGAMDPLEISYCSHSLQPGDQLLLCSDGLTNSVPEPDWEDILKNAGSTECAVETLIETALDNQASDNVSVVLMTLN